MAIPTGLRAVTYNITIWCIYAVVVAWAPTPLTMLVGFWGVAFAIRMWSATLLFTADDGNEKSAILLAFVLYDGLGRLIALAISIAIIWAIGLAWPLGLRISVFLLCGYLAVNSTFPLNSKGAT